MAWAVCFARCESTTPSTILVYAGIDPVTGRQRQIAPQVKGKREAERLEAGSGGRRRRHHPAGEFGRLP